MTAARQYAVIGLGIFGSAVCEALHGLGHEVLAIDDDERLVRAAHEGGLATHAVVANALNVHALRELNIHQFDVVVVAIGTELDASILVVLNLLDLGVRRVVAKATTAMHARVLARVGGDAVQVVNPEQEMGRRIAHQLADVAFPPPAGGAPGP